MATYAQGTVSVGTTATVIATPGLSNQMVVQNNGTTAVFLGGSNVTTSGATAGIQVAANATVAVPVAGDRVTTLYGICASGTNNVSYLYVD